MQLHRFEEDYTIPISDFGSNFMIGPLTGPDSRVQIHVMHLPAGGRIGRHPTVGRQLFCVVRGEGWASGADGRRWRLRTGDAASWEPGEEHESGSDAGLTALNIEGEFEIVGRGILREIVVVDYDPAWTQWFEQVRAVVWPAIEDVAIRVDHVGSTSVPGLVAKPIIDTDIVVASEEDVRPVIERLASIGYRWRGDMGVPGRQAFIPEPAVAEGLPAHHLYLVVEDNRAHLDHYLLRDLLREDEDARRRYGDLKRQNAALANGDIDAYGQAKAALVAELLTRARAERGLEPVDYWQPEVDWPDSADPG